jgi:prepilin-type N-terminal cleavage/methylation domain-containing protein
VHKIPECKNQYNNRGFTLLEVLVAMIVLLVGILSSAGLYYIVARNNTTGNVATQAVMLAQSRIDQIKNTADITSLNGAFASEVNIVPLRGDQQPMVGGGVFSIDYRFCDPMNDILAGAYAPPNAFQGDMCSGAVTPANFAQCGSAPSCQVGTSSTCLAAVRVSWNRVGSGRSGNGCVVLQTLTQGRGI